MNERSILQMLQYIIYLIDGTALFEMVEYAIHTNNIFCMPSC